MTNKGKQAGRPRTTSFALTAALAIVALAAAGGTDFVCAQSDAPQQSPRASEIDHSTNEWLALQRSNTAAAPVRPMLGAEANLAYKRYLESFNSKIPDFFGSSVSQAGAGGSQGGTLPQN
jgi:N-acetylmuramic acid 6-phosphate (MurNAc-6-P) etherase